MAINIWKSYVCTAVEETNIESIIAVMPEHYWTSNDRFPVGLLAQLVERCTGIAKFMGSNPVQAWIFFQALFQMLVQWFS